MAIVLKSPCIKKCSIAPKVLFCTGCFRTMQEISEWPLASDERKSEILRLLRARRATSVADKVAPENG